MSSKKGGSFAYDKIPNKDEIGSTQNIMAANTHHHRHHKASSSELTSLTVTGEPQDEEAELLAPNQYALTLIFLCVFVGDMARGILFPTLWLFVQQLGVRAGQWVTHSEDAVDTAHRTEHALLCDNSPLIL